MSDTDPSTFDQSAPRGRVLVVAGSDSGGGAGIQADIKTITVLGGYAATAITALTVQNTVEVQAVHPAPLAIVEGQMRAVLADIGADAIKTGMLPDADVIEAVARTVEESALPLILDPVMVAASGAILVPDEAMTAMRGRLAPLSYLVTPNAPEAHRLTGIEVEDVDGQRAAGEALLELGAKAALIKGGHIDSAEIIDVLVTRNGMRIFSRPRLNVRHTHGTGCTLASACAALIAQGISLDRAVEQAGDYLHEAIRRGPGFGAGHGPVDHAWPIRDAGAFGRSPVRGE